MLPLGSLLQSLLITSLPSFLKSHLLSICRILWENKMQRLWSRHCLCISFLVCYVWPESVSLTETFWIPCVNIVFCAQVKSWHFLEFWFELGIIFFMFYSKWQKSCKADDLFPRRLHGVMQNVKWIICCRILFTLWPQTSSLMQVMF